MAVFSGESNRSVQVFENIEFGQIRTVVGADGEPWFVAKDVANALGYAQTSNMVKRLDEEDFVSSKLDGMNMNSILLNESGLYAAIMGSQLPKAKAFKHWVTHDVIPSIRKTGAYSLAPRTLQEALRAYADELDAHENTRRALAESNEQVEGLKVRLDESESFWSILKLCERYGFDWNIKKRGLAGKRASAYCRRHGYEIRRAHDDRFGEVNTYPCEVLDKLFVANRF